MGEGSESDGPLTASAARVRMRQLAEEILRGSYAVTEAGGTAGEELARLLLESPAERWAAQMRRQIAEMVGEGLTEEFVSVAASGGRSAEDVAMLMAICYVRGRAERA